MYAVIETGGKQYRVEVGTELAVELLDVGPGDSLRFDRVLLVADGETAAIGRPIVANASVAAEVVRRERGEKVISFKYRPKARRRVKKGHRQELTLLRISDIVLDGHSAAADAAEAEAARKRDRAKLEDAARRQAAADAELAAKLQAEKPAPAAPKARASAAKAEGKPGAKAEGKAGAKAEGKAGAKSVPKASGKVGTAAETAGAAKARAPRTTTKTSSAKADARRAPAKAPTEPKTRAGTDKSPAKRTTKKES